MVGLNNAPNQDIIVQSNSAAALEKNVAQRKKEALDKICKMYVDRDEPIDVMVKRIEDDFFDGQSSSQTTFKTVQVTSQIIQNKKKSNSKGRKRKNNHKAKGNLSAHTQNMTPVKSDGLN